MTILRNSHFFYFIAKNVFTKKYIYTIITIVENICSIKKEVFIMKVLLLGAKLVDFSSATGERILMTKISYVVPGTGLNEDGYLGNPPIQVTVQENITPSLVQLPGIYNLEFTMVPGKNNAPTMKLQEVKFINAIDLEKCLK